MKQIITLALAGMLVFMLAACGSGGTPEITTETTTGFVMEAAAEEESEYICVTGEATSNEAISIDVATTIAGEAGTGEGLEAPIGKAEILVLYNGALAKSGGLTRTLYSWDVLTAKFTDVKIAGFRQDDIDTLDTMNPLYRNYRDREPTAHGLVRLTDAQVSSAALKKQEGRLATYEIQLKPATADQSMQGGHAGYAGNLTWTEIDMLLTLAADGMSYTASIDKFSLSNGKLLVTIDLESGAIQAAECSFTQEATGPLRLYVVGTATIVLKFTAKSTYQI